MSDQKKVNSKKGVRVYPVATSIFLIIGAIVLSIVDLSFLSDVIGQVLNRGETVSFLISTALGLIGLAIMAHEGTRIAHGHNAKTEKLVNYALWVTVGLTLAGIRLFEKNIVREYIQGTSDAGISADKIFNISSIGGSDIILAPLMFLLYLATGLMVKDGVQNLLMNPEFEVWWNNFKKWLKDIFGAKELDTNLEFMRLIRDGDKSLSNNDYQEATNNYSEAKTWAESNKLGSDKVDLAVNKLTKCKTDQEYYRLLQEYDDAFNKYKIKENLLKNSYDIINNNIDFVFKIDAQEESFEKSIKPGLLHIVNETILSTQNSIALLTRKITNVDILELQSAITEYNKNKIINAKKEQ